MKDYLEEILVESDKIHTNAFDIKGLRERFQKLDESNKELFNKVIEQKLFSNVFWKNCFSDDVFKTIYSIFDKIEK